MRELCAGVILALVLGAGVPSVDAKPKKPDVGAGRITWFDIAVTDLAKAKAFYAALFDWKFTALPGTDKVAEIVSGDTPIGTLRVAHGKLSTENGVVYVQVDDAQAACAKATQLGGKVVEGFPFNLPDGGGGVGLLVDPTGAPVGVYSQKSVPEALAPDAAR